MTNLLYNLTSAPTLMFMIIALRFLAVDVAKVFTAVVHNWPPLGYAGMVMMVAVPVRSEYFSHLNQEHSPEPEVHAEKYELVTRFLKSRMLLDKMSNPSSVEVRTWSAARYWTNYLTILDPSMKHTA